MWNYRRMHLYISGDRACFTDPLFASERSSYPVMTRTAAAGILKAIYFKPEFSYVIDSITVLNKIQTVIHKVNERDEHFNLDVLTSEIGNSKKNKKDKIPAPHSYIEGKIIQRNTSYLRNVAYIISFHILAKDCEDSKNGVNVQIKHEEIFRRRAQLGQCFNHPYLGLRECSATTFELLDFENKLKIIQNGFYYGKGEYDIGNILVNIDYEKVSDFSKENFTPDYYTILPKKMVDGVISFGEYQEDGI